MRPPYTLSGIGQVAFRPYASMPAAAVCVFCLHHARLPFSTSIPRPVDPNRKLRKAQTQRQKRYQELKDAQRSPEQLLPRIRHEEEVAWQRVVKLAKRNGEPLPDKSKWRADLEREKRKANPLSKLPPMEKKALRAWQESFDKATDEIDTPRATNWDGMEMVGGEVEWDTGLVFEGFLPKTKLSSNAEITAAMYRAIVEVFTAVAHGENLLTLENSYNLLGPIFEDIRQVKISITEQEGAQGEAISLQYPSEEAKNRIHRTLIAEEDGIEPQPDVQPRISEPQDIVSLDEQISAWGKQWHRVTLADPTIKLAIIKRLTSLLGTRIPDLTIHAHNTVGPLLAQLVKPPPPARLHDALAKNDVLRALPNLTLQDHKLSLVQKETTIGRWKVIRHELHEHGLPILNTAKVRGVDEPEHNTTA